MGVPAIFLRHRLVTALSLGFLVVLAVLGGAFGASRAETTYQSSGTVLVIPPGAGNPQATLNPFINLNQNMTQLTQALSARLSSPDLLRQAQAQAPALVGYVAKVVYDSSVTNPQPSSQLQFTAQATDPQVARDAVQHLMTQASDELKDIQLHAGVTEPTLAQSVVLVEATEPEVMPVSSARAAGIWAITGVLVGLVILAVLFGVWWQFGGGRGDRGGDVADDAPLADDPRADRDPGDTGSPASTDDAGGVDTSGSEGTSGISDGWTVEDTTEAIRPGDDAVTEKFEVMEDERR